MSNDISKTLLKIFKLLASDRNFNNFELGKVFIGKDHEKLLLDFSENNIKSPIGDVTSLLIQESNKLPDNKIDFDCLQKLVKILSSNNSMKRLNHIGFCYQKPSSLQEKIRLLDTVSDSFVHFYEEPSNNEDIWLFLGNIEKWDDPTLEFVLIQNTNDPDKDYWLPHIQIDIDTTLNSMAIEKLVMDVYGRKPFPIVIDGKTYIMRVRLGRVEGVNIFLDLATNLRDVSYLKHNIWKPLQKEGQDP